ncbi:MAG TPA: PKD domain-containing protein [Chitinophagales bacterium]|nr:PKD domain-containing protein [Chitinophagales bacterium]
MKTLYTAIILFVILYGGSISAACGFTVSFNVVTSFAPCPPFPVHFYNASSDTSLHWLWSFGDGSTSTSYEPAHVYYYPGQYTIKLVATSTTPPCTDSVVLSNMIRVKGPSGNFAITPDSGCMPLSVTISGTMQSTADFVIDMGDGQVSQNTMPTTHTYTSVGTYYPSVTLEDSVGCMVYIPVDTVTVSGICPVPIDTVARPFASAGAHWCQVTSYFFENHFSEPIFYRDTVLQGIPCTNTGSGCLFEKSDTVYRILPDSSIRFLYDYAAQKGDIWDIYMQSGERSYLDPDDSLIQVRIDTSYALNIRGQITRVLHTRVIDTSYYGYSLGRVIEHIGGSYTFIPGPWGYADDGIPFVMCYQDSAIGSVDVWPLRATDSCVCHVWMGQNEIETKTQFSIAPNPASNSIVVSINASNVDITLTITDLTGSRVVETKLTSSNMQLSTEALPDGLYFVTVSSGLLKATQKLIITK